ncbi:hypothetical protein WN944_000923 [Citrus x changshan-huyou]|uniref:Uncharacterized protein n=1 Tax=Citrus x changshan-huyou TaxID=2935761 RepID=A0AAP0MFI7_9ROSI
MEDGLNAVMDRVDSKRIWLALLPKHTSHTFFALDLCAWIVCNMKNHLKITNEKDWPVLFGVTIWRMWYWHNQFVHTHKTSSLSNIIMDVKNRSEELIVVYKSFDGQRTPKTEQWIY